MTLSDLQSAAQIIQGIAALTVIPGAGVLLGIWKEIQKTHISILALEMRIHDKFVTKDYCVHEHETTARTGTKQ